MKLREDLKNRNEDVRYEIFFIVRDALLSEHAGHLVPAEVKEVFLVFFRETCVASVGMQQPLAFTTKFLREGVSGDVEIFQHAVQTC